MYGGGIFQRENEMNHVSCVIFPDRVKVFAGNNILIGYVMATRDGEAAYHQYVPHTLTFNDMDIIQDCWAAYEEMYKKNLTSVPTAVK